MTKNKFIIASKVRATFKQEKFFCSKVFLASLDHHVEVYIHKAIAQLKKDGKRRARGKDVHSLL